MQHLQRTGLAQSRQIGGSGGRLQCIQQAAHQLIERWPALLCPGFESRHLQAGNASVQVRRA